MGDYHNYRIDQGLADCWWLYVDGNQLGSYKCIDEGKRALGLKVVLETYESTADVPAHRLHELRKRRWENSFEEWAGRDAKHVDQQEGVMCGIWLSDVDFRVAENDPC
ncbi:MAG: hypothetical protein H0V36_10965 [Chloroflexi bacterium]|nr:hypothetical protein [Chloroflexota bacterium]